MNNVTHGNYSEDRQKTMAAYDQLPPDYREVFRNSIIDWATGPSLRRLRKDIKSGLSEERVVRSHVDWHIRSDAAQVRKDAKKDWGKQAVAYVEAQPKRRLRDWFDAPARSLRPCQALTS